MKRMISGLLSLVLLLGCLNGLALSVNAATDDITTQEIATKTATGNTTEFAGGSGTAEDPYLISTKEHLDNVRFYLSAHFKMIADIEFTDADFSEGGAFYNNGTGWKTMNSFTGTFDGNGYAIKGMQIRWIDTNAAKTWDIWVSMFGCVYGAVRNLHMTDVDFSVEYRNVYKGRLFCGAIAAKLEGTIENCSVSGTINGSGDVIMGGLVGICKGKIDACYNSAEVHGTYATGGIAGGLEGHENGAKITNCYNKGNIYSWDGGGISGYVNTNGYKNIGIERSYNVGNVRGSISATSFLVYAITESSEKSQCYYLKGSGKDNYIVSFTDAQMKTKSSFGGFDFKSVWTMGGDANYPYPELQCFALCGTISIQGNVVYNETVKADISGLNQIPQALTYQWCLDGEPIYSGETYTVKSTDIGKKLTLTVSSTEEYCSGSVTSAEYMVSKAIQIQRPVVPELLYLDDNKFEISTIATQEYSIDNINWQSVGVFENLDPNKTYTVYSRILENDLYLLGESTDVLSVGTDRRPMTGKVSITGTARYGDTLTADASGLLPAGATFTYEWKSGSKVVGTGKTYKITQADIGNSIVLYVKGTDDYIGTISSAAVVATKTTVQLPNAPVVANKTNTAVTLVAKTGYEYSMDKVVWQDSPVFTGLSAANEYVFYQRAKETATTFASKASNGTSVTTLKNTVSEPAKPVVEKITNNSVTLKAMDGYEYSLDGIKWQSSHIFTGLKPYTEYSFCQRIAESKTDYASAQSGYTIIITLKNTVAAPAAPTIQKATATSVTLTAISGYEYSKDGKTWQTSNVFTGLTTLKTYTFYQRIRETNTDYTSSVSAGTSFKVKNVADEPAAPTLKEKTNNKIVVEVKTSYEYSINKTTWNTTGTFTGLQPNQAYTIYCRISETDTHYASAVSSALTVTTLKNTVSAPSAPVLSTKTSNSVTLVPNSLYEYSKDGETWQASNVFSGLSPNTEYTFYQRKEETSTAYASEKSTALKVCTPKQSIAAPAAPVLSTKTATSITLVKTSGYEYSKDGKTWQSSNVFEGLTPNTKYSFYQRKAETETAYASTTSSALTITTPKYTVSAPEKPVLAEHTMNSVTLQKFEGYEYSKDGTTWQTSNVFSGLNANTAYIFYQRIAETGTSSASEASASLSVRTASKKACSVSPVSPIIAETTTSKVVLVTREGYEYSKNGTSWQASNVFTGLSSNTSYTFYQRIAETDDELASAKSSGVTVKTLESVSGTTSAQNYNKLYSYIEKNGRVASDGTRFLPITITANGKEYELELSLTSSGIVFWISSYDGKIWIDTSFTLQKSSKTLIASSYIGGTIMISSYPYYVIDDVSNSINIDRSTYTGNNAYKLKQSGDYITASNASELFNAHLKLSTSLFDKYLYDHLGFGLMGLGFTSYNGYGSVVCDIPSSKHIGSTEKRNTYAATCTTNGYTGDVYCLSCGEKKSSGTVIASKGNHTYSNTCDKDCNTCGEERIITHTYSGYCDTSCNVCGTTRTVLLEHYYANGKSQGSSTHTVSCTGCGITKSSAHIWDTGKITQAPSCDSAGIYTYTCTGCPQTKTETITVDHNFGEWEHNSTSTHIHYCAVCNKSETASHSWDSGKLTQIPTANAPGIMTYTCSVCGYTKTEEVNFIPGDIDGNGTVNRDDVIALLLHVSMPAAFPISIPADYNGDGLVTRDDVIQLLLHVSMPDAFPLQ